MAGFQLCTRSWVDCPMHQAHSCSLSPVPTPATQWGLRPQKAGVHLVPTKSTAKRQILVWFILYTFPLGGPSTVYLVPWAVY